MKAIIWNYVNKLNLKPKTRQRLFLAAVSLLWGLVGALLWVLLGSKIFPGRIDWMLCFIGYPAVILGFLSGIYYIFKVNDR